jgi:hypothetical protein
VTHPFSTTKHALLSVKADAARLSSPESLFSVILKSAYQGGPFDVFASVLRHKTFGRVHLFLYSVCCLTLFIMLPPSINLTLQAPLLGSDTLLSKLFGPVPVKFSTLARRSHQCSGKIQQIDSLEESSSPGGRRNYFGRSK